MTVKLGNIVLHENLLLTGIETANDISVSSVVTLGGLTSTAVMPLTGGRILSLVAMREGDKIKSRFLLSELNEIRLLAAAGIPTTVTHHRGIFTVLILSTTDVVPVLPEASPQPDDWYTGPIQLLEG